MNHLLVDFSVSVKAKKVKTCHMCSGTHLDWIIFFPPLLLPVTFTLCLCALSLIEAQKPEEEIELQIELHPKVI